VAENLKKRDNLGDTGIDGQIILIRILKKYVTNANGIP
jgi:hypothetical protein